MLSDLEKLVASHDPSIHEGILLKLEEAKEIVKQFKALESRLRINNTVSHDPGQH